MLNALLLLAAASGGSVIGAATAPPNASAVTQTAPSNAGTPGSTPTPGANATATAGDHTTSNGAAPEPGGYWTGPVNSPVPAALSGGKVISSARHLHTLLKHRDTVLIDVSNAPHHPDNMAPGAPWLPLPHRAIPGTVWIPGVGAGDIPATLDRFFRQKLATATDNDPTRRVVIYCHRTCWLSWNAAKRAISYGYQHVYWYRDGIEGWKAAGLPTAVIEPQSAPEH